MEDYRHLKLRVLERLPKQEQHALWARFVEPLIRARTDAEFVAVWTRSNGNMPAALRNYLIQGAGPAQRSVLQRIKGMFARHALVY